jgi:L-aminopeptidase/D-esterase-like protein
MSDTITAVRGVSAGHWTDDAHHTGVTAVLTVDGARGAVFVPGGAPGSRELATLEPWHLVDRIHGVCLAGGSAFGLAAADGVVAELAERGVGFRTPHGVVPIVPAAIIYDLHSATRRPDAWSGRAAARAATCDPLPRGRVGAGAGARVGQLYPDASPGGLGGAAGAGIGAVAVVNAAGQIRRYGGPLPERRSPVDALGPARATTLGVVAVEATLSAGQAQMLARMASAGMARVIAPAFTPFDGDLVFVLATGVEGPVDAAGLARLGDDAATTLAHAIVDALPPPAPWQVLDAGPAAMLGHNNLTAMIFTVTRGRAPGTMARHRRTPQWLAALDGAPFGVWLSPPGPTPRDPAWVEVPAGAMLGLAPGTWHRGPVPLPEGRVGRYLSLEAPHTGTDDHEEQDPATATSVP